MLSRAQKQRPDQQTGEEDVQAQDRWDVRHNKLTRWYSVWEEWLNNSLRQQVKMMNMVKRGTDRKWHHTTYSTATRQNLPRLEGMSDIQVLHYEIICNTMFGLHFRILRPTVNPHQVNVLFSFLKLMIYSMIVSLLFSWSYFWGRLVSWSWPSLLLPFVLYK